MLERLLPALRIAAVLGGLCLPALARAGDGVELFENGGFEAGITGWRPIRFDRAEPDRKQRHEGKQSLRLVKEERGPTAFLKQSGELPGGAGEVTVGLAYRVDKGSRVRVTAYFFDARGETVGKGQMPLAQSGRTRRFETCEETFEVPGGATGFGINVMLEQPGTVWIDAVSASFEGAGGKGQGGAAEPDDDFELAGGERAEDVLARWLRLREPSSTEADLHTRRKKSGKRALRLVRQSPRLAPLEGVRRTHLLVGKRKKAVLTVQVAGDGKGARAFVSLQALGAGGTPLGAVRAESSPGRGFEREKLTLKLPAGAERIEIVLAVRGAGEVLFDDLKVDLR